MTTDYLNLKLRQQVEELKASLAAEPTTAANAEARARIVWPWLNAAALAGQHAPPDLPLVCGMLLSRGAIGERIRHDPRLPVVAGSPGLSGLCARAIFAQQTADDGIDYIRRHYGQMLDENGGTFSECWATPADEAACKSQGWGGTLAATLIEEVVGLRPVEPGCGRLVWRPPVCRLSFAEGRFDTPRGPVAVRWEADGALRYDVPEGVSLEIRAKANVLEA